MIRYMKIFTVLTLIAITGQCSSNQEKIKDPPLGNPTEFHKKPRKYIPIVYGNYSNRGLDNSDDVEFYDHLGMGFGTLINVPMGPQWTGHKFLYYYIDVETDVEYAGYPYPGDKANSIAMNPGIYMRSYMPFWMKVRYGAGIHTRFYNTSYDRWGIYGEFGLEFWNITYSVVFTGYPGQGDVDTKYRLGYIFAPINF